MEVLRVPMCREIRPISSSLLPHSFSAAGPRFRLDRVRCKDEFVTLPRYPTSRQKCCRRITELFTIRSTAQQNKQTRGLPEIDILRRNVIRTALAIWGLTIVKDCLSEIKAFAAVENLPITRRVFFDISVDGQAVGEVVVGLYGSEVPVGTQRFAELAIGQKGIGYRKKEFGKITPRYIQNNGVRSFSLSGGATDAASFTGGSNNKSLVTEMAELDKRGSRPKNVAGAVSLFVVDPTKPPAKTKLVAKKGKLIVLEEESRPDPNGTEFMFVTADSPDLDSSNLVVGCVVEGYDVIKKIAATRVVNENSSSLYFQTAKLIGDSRAVVAEKGFYKPYSKIVITKSGEIR